MKAYSVLVISAIMAVGPAGCASQSGYSAQFFKASRADQHVPVISILQTTATPSSK